MRPACYLEPDTVSVYSVYASHGMMYMALVCLQPNDTIRRIKIILRKH